MSTNPLQIPADRTHFDYIIAGAGAAGLSLLTRMIGSGKFANKQILLLDKSPKTANDRTWCFWEKEPGFFESIVYKSWNSLWFHGEGFSKLFEILPYRYKMIRGIDFYEHCFRIIAAQPNITVLYGNVEGMESKNDQACLTIDRRTFSADYLFNSIILEKPDVTPEQFYLLQHFKGWIIESAEPVFQVREATLMDFRVLQHKGTAFVYVMPFSATRALVEFTMFSEKLLSPEKYEASLRSYIAERTNCKEYKVVSEEFGVIPMTNFRFPAAKDKIINIGTAGGQTKGSTGYTFMAIQKKTAAIVQELSRRKKLSAGSLNTEKYHFYDSVLLNVLASGKLAGHEVFTRLFQKNGSDYIFRFLDNASTLGDDLKLISSLPTMPFLRAGMEEIPKMFRYYFAKWKKPFTGKSGPQPDRR